MGIQGYSQPCAVTACVTCSAPVCLQDHTLDVAISMGTTPVSSGLVLAPGLSAPITVTVTHKGEAVSDAEVTLLAGGPSRVTFLVCGKARPHFLLPGEESRL